MTITVIADMKIGHRHHDTVRAVISRDGLNYLYTLWWSDGVTDEWMENYDTLSAALARVALLADCAVGGWAPCFEYNDLEHETNWQKFSATNLDYPVDDNQPDRL